MISDEIVTLFRSAMGDTEFPFVYSDPEAYTFLNDAYFMFARLTDGVADFTSAITALSVVVGETDVAVSAKILRFMSAKRRSDGRPLEIINAVELDPRNLIASRELTRMIIGQERGLVRWGGLPTETDTVDLHVYRLPLVAITGAGAELVDVDEQHHLHLISWMKFLAYDRPEDNGGSDKEARKCRDAFTAYCAQAKLEQGRAKHKNRVVVYGGI